MQLTDYWLLDVVVEHAEPISMLLPSIDEDALQHFAVAFNRASHGLALQELTDALCDLFNNHYLVAQWSPLDPYQQATKPFTPTRKQIEEALTNTRQKRQQTGSSFLLYQLTLKGGEAWEAVTQANWSLFVRREEAYGSTYLEAFSGFPRVGEFEEPADTAVSPLQANKQSIDESDAEAKRLHIRMAGSNRSLIADYVSFDKNILKAVVDHSERWTDWTPWQATYWKFLPQGYEICYTIYSNHELQQQSGKITTHTDLDHQPERRMPAWYTDYITGLRV